MKPRAPRHFAWPPDSDVPPPYITVRALRGFCVGVPLGDVQAGDTVEVPMSRAREFVEARFAEPVDRGAYGKALAATR